MDKIVHGVDNSYYKLKPTVPQFRLLPRYDLGTLLQNLRCSIDGSRSIGALSSLDLELVLDLQNITFKQNR